MELREFAERVLLGTRLKDKLLDPGELTDRRPGQAWRTIAAPGRPRGLEISEHADAFPSIDALDDPQMRGRALHFFANHELLALELMALALLRFPDAPAALRRGLAATLRDEQRHLGLYLQRMGQLGGALGDARLGGFFWRTVAGLDDPRRFLAHMSLTFEQANLDHARYFRDVFARLGDAETAAVMNTVYADEIRHVHFGVSWFQRDVEPDALLDAHRDALVSPVTLRRARGRHFDDEGRQRAGLPDAYVSALKNVPSSRGRAPVVHLFDPTCELDLAHDSDYTPDRGLRRRIEDLELLPALYARHDDVVLVRRQPRDGYLATLRRAGLVLPELVTADLDAPRIDALGDLPIARVQPWGWTPRLARRLAALRGRSLHDPVPAAGWPPEVFSKVRAVEISGSLLGAPETCGVVVRSGSELEGAVDELAGDGHATIAVKAPLGTAGRGTIRLHGGTIEPGQRGWIDRVLRRQGALIVEPWLDRVCDLSFRLWVEAPGEARIDHVGRFLTDARGQYLGAVLGRATSGLPADVARFLHTGPHRLEHVAERVRDAVARSLAPTGYVGPVGVDAFVHRTDAGLRLRPVVELNPRIHMGHVAWHLQRLVAPGRAAQWRLVRAADVRRAGHPTLADWASLLGERHPVRTAGDTGRLGSGVLFTNDPEQAQEVLGVLAVASTWAEIEHLWPNATALRPTMSR